MSILIIEDHHQSGLKIWEAQDREDFIRLVHDKFDNYSYQVYGDLGDYINDNDYFVVQKYFHKLKDVVVDVTTPVLSIYSFSSGDIEFEQGDDLTAEYDYAVESLNHDLRRLTIIETVADAEYYMSDIYGLTGKAYEAVKEFHGREFA